jgi:hypothetical protein
MDLTILFVHHDIYVTLADYLYEHNKRALREVNKILSKHISTRHLRDIIREIFRAENLSLFMWIEDKSYKNPEYFYKAIICNNLNAVKYLHTNGYPCYEYLTSCAAATGNLELVKYLYNSDIIPIKPSVYELTYYNAEQYTYTKNTWKDEKVFAIAASTGNIDLIEYLHENKFPYNEDAFNYANTIEMIKYLHQHDFPHNHTLFYKATQFHKLEIVKYLHENEYADGAIGLPVIDDATRMGRLDIVKYLHENGYMYGEETFTNAITSGNVKLVEYLHGIGCPYDGSIYIDAVWTGNLDIIKYLYQNNFRYSEEAIITAVECESFDVLKYLHEMNFPYYSDDIAEVVGGVKNPEIIKFLEIHGYIGS